VAGVTIVARLLGFGRWLAQAHGVGGGAIGDAYNSANLLPNVLFEVAAGGALAGAVVPVLAGPVRRGARDEVDRVVGGALGWTFLVLVPLGGLLAALAGPIAGLLPGPEALVPTVRFFIVVFAVQVPLYGCAVLLYAVLQVHHRFFWPAFAPALASVVTIAAYLAYGALAGGETQDPSRVPGSALDWLAWGTTAGVAAMVVPLLGPVRRAGVRLRPSLRFPPGVGRRLAALALTGVGGVVAQQVTYLVVMLVAKDRGGDGTGTLSVYNWTQAVYLLPYAVLVVPLATSTFPRLAALATGPDRVGLARLGALTTRAVLVAGAVGGALLVAVAPAVAGVFVVVEGSARSTGLVGEMAPTLVRMAVGVVGYGLLFHLSRTLFALERGRRAVAGTAAGWLTAAALAVVLTRGGAPDPVRTLHALGLAVGAGMVVGAVVLLVLVRGAVGPGILVGLGRTAVVAGVGAVVGAALGYVATLAAAGRPLPWQDVPPPTDEPGLLRWLLAAALGALVAGAVTAVVVLLGDRGVLRGLRGAGDPGPAPAEPAVAGDETVDHPDAETSSSGRGVDAPDTPPQR
jgi:putative peptidoglycan lipid II flippase